MKREDVKEIFSTTAAAHIRFADAEAHRLETAALAVREALQAGHKVLAFGNGGSAGDAEHLVAELVGRFQKERRSLPAMALTCNTSLLTAVANDYGYDHVFARQVEALGQSGDVAIGISTSGRSRNVEIALEVARGRGLVTVALTGNEGGRMGADADIHVNVRESSTARIQEVHRTILHALCTLVEQRL